MFGTHPLPFGFHFVLAALCLQVAWSLFSALCLCWPWLFLLRLLCSTLILSSSAFRWLSLLSCCHTSQGPWYCWCQHDGVVFLFNGLFPVVGTPIWISIAIHHLPQLCNFSSSSQLFLLALCSSLRCLKFFFEGRPILTVCSELLLSHSTLPHRQHLGYLLFAACLEYCLWALWLQTWLLCFGDTSVDSIIGLLLILLWRYLAGSIELSHVLIALGSLFLCFAEQWRGILSFLKGWMQ